MAEIVFDLLIELYGELRDSFPNVPIIALTATLCTEGIKDVIDTLRLDDPKMFIHNLDRPSIQYNIVYKLNEIQQILDIVKKYNKKDCGIIYCMTRQKTEDLAEMLKSKGLNCEAYHAGLNKKEKASLLERYIKKDLNLLVATIAFGMGIDRSDVRYVVHTDVPSNMEAYVQEIGRASRDGLPSKAFMLYSKQDVDKQIWLLRQSVKHPARLQLNIQKIKNFKKFCEDASKCRREGILSYFDQTLDDCGNCDVCLNHQSLSDCLSS